MNPLLSTTVTKQRTRSRSISGMLTRIKNTDWPHKNTQFLKSHSRCFARVMKAIVSENNTETGAETVSFPKNDNPNQIIPKQERNAIMNKSEQPVAIVTGASSGIGLRITQGFLSLTRKGIDEDFVPDLRPAERANIYAIQGAWNWTCLADKVSVPAWTTKPSRFIAAANDRMLPPEYEKAVAEHIHATTTTLATGHMPMLSSPKQVAAVIIEAANTPFTALDAAHASAQFVFPANFHTQEIQTDGATIHVRVGGQGPAVVLLHGFGDTGDMWAPTAAELARDHRVVVPDLRGMGLSSHPAGGYDKKTQAADIRSVLTQLGIDRAAVVGHDIGATVAYAYAARYPDKTDRLVVMDAPVPGIPPWDEIVRSPALWHFSFGGPDAERLVAGRERIYLDRFWNEFAGDPSKIDEATRVHYTAFYAQPGAMHSAFAQFLSIPKDAEDNKVSMTTKLTMPVLAIGAAKAFGANVAIVMRNAADNVTEVLIANSGHWLMEEQPAATIAAVHNFLDRNTTTQSQ